MRRPIARALCLWKLSEPLSLDLNIILLQPPSNDSLVRQNLFAKSSVNMTAGYPSFNKFSVMEHPTVVPQSPREDESLPKDLETYVPRTIRDPQAAVHILFLLQNFHRLDSKEEITQLLETVPYLQKGDGEKWWKENRVNASKVQLLDNLFTTLVVAMGRRKTPSPPHIEQTSLKSIATSLAHMNPDQRVNPYKLMSILLELLALNKEDKISVEELVSETLGFPQKGTSTINSTGYKAFVLFTSIIESGFHSPSCPFKTSPSSTQKSTQASKSHARVKSPPSASLTSITSNASVIHSERLKNSWILRSTQTKDVDKFEEPDSEHEAFKTTYVVVLESKESTSGEKKLVNLSGPGHTLTKDGLRKLGFLYPAHPEEGKKYLNKELQKNT
ncbi:hypothetical protein K435DRAFT_805343 [Dendrothele bispora CBS 962.96]|uniref:Uncharacterized protein n=1 Tax=Dendrothele bispora (strain CBS 962.96) TaxID=1314807 RepID=A0A4S8LC25_DENBC|nr:hypothetical protein K435DRAFT_805343 [Dendrothele bispora CBS 962.96]